MTRPTRIVAAVVLAVAFAASPLVADWCAAMCEVARTSATPSCHHSSSATPRLSRTTTPCSHDHRPVVMDAATKPVPGTLVDLSLLETSSVLASAAPILGVIRVAVDIRPALPLVLALATPLRI